MGAIQENEFAFAEYLSVSQVERMEKEEAVHGENVDTSQARQAIEKILRNAAGNP
jgi:hypothetical protein